MTLSEFAQLLQSLALLTAEQLAAVRTQIATDDLGAFSQALVDQKLLTKYQVRKILEGDAKSLVLGNYLILDKLGQGGMGMVLKARHRRMERIVALKVLSPDVVKTPELVARFQREVRAAARLEHPHIVAAHDADEADGTFFLVLQFVAGHDLATVVKRKGTLPVHAAVQCVLQTARGLEYAHSQGVIHRDIKPSNLLVDSKGQVKILDMGLARLEEDTAQQAELTGTGTIMGTVDYMSPEQALSTKNADARSDIYSLGITLWYLLVGRPAYEGDTLMARMLAHREAPLPSLCQVRSDVPAALEQVFHRMIAKRPEQRYQTMGQVIHALETYPQGAVLPANAAVAAAAGDSRLDQFLNQISVAEGTYSPGSQPADESIPTNQPTIVAGRPSDETDTQLRTMAGGSPLTRRFAGQHQKSSGPWIWLVGGVAAVILLAGVGLQSGLFGRVPSTASKTEIGKDSGSTSNTNSSDQTPQIPVDPVWPIGPEDQHWHGIVANPTAIPGLKRWQLETVAPRGLVYAISWSPDSSRLVAYSAEQRLRVYRWDGKTLELEQVIQSPHGGGNIQWAWSPDGRWLAWITHGGDTLSTWDLQERKPGPAFASRVGALAGWNSDGTQFVLGGNDTAGRGVLIYDWPSGELKSALATGVDIPQFVAWSADKLWLAASNRLVGVQIWSAEGEPRPTIKLPENQQLAHIAWSPTKPDLLVGYLHDEVGTTTERILVYDMGDIEHPKPISPPAQDIDQWMVPVWTGDGSGVLIARATLSQVIGLDGTLGPTIQFANHPSHFPPVYKPGTLDFVCFGYHPDVAVRSGMEAKSSHALGGQAYTTGGWSPNGRWLAMVSNWGTLQVWELTPERLIGSLPANTTNVTALQWHSDNRRLLQQTQLHQSDSYSNTIAVLSESGETRSQYTVKYKGPMGNSSWIGNSDQILIHRKPYAEPSPLSIWNTSGSEVRETTPPALKSFPFVYACRFAADGDQFVFFGNQGSGDNSQLYFARMSQRLVKPVPLKDIHAVGDIVWKENGSECLIASVFDGHGRIDLCLPETGQRLASLAMTLETAGWISPDGSNLLYPYNNVMATLHGSSLEVDRPFNSSWSNEVRCAWRPDSKQFVISDSSQNLRLKIWRNPPILVEHELPLEGVLSVSWRRDGKRISAGSKYGLLRNWQPVKEGWQTEWTRIELPNAEWAVFGPGGRLLRSSPKALSFLRVVSETDSGSTTLQSAAEFYESRKNLTATPTQ